MNEGDSAEYTMVLNTRPSGDVSVVVLNSDTPGAVMLTGQMRDRVIVDFTTTNWSMVQTITVMALQDGNSVSESITLIHQAISDPPYDITLTIPNVTVTVMDDDTAGVMVSSPTLTVVEGSSANYTVALTSEPSDSVTLTPVSSATSAATVSGALTFTTGNWDTAQTVQVSGVATGRMATITHQAVSTDSNYSTTFTTPSVAVTVTPPPTSLTLRAATLMPAEGATVTLTAVLDNPAPRGGTTVMLTASGTAAGAGANPDYSLSPTAITIAAGAREGTATIIIASDSVSDDGETIILDASSSNPTLTATAITLTIADVPPGLTVDPATLTVAEGAMATYTLVLRTPPSADVVVTVMHTSPADAEALSLDGLASDNTLTFSTGDWSTPQTVTVISVQNEEPGNVMVTLSHTVASADTDYANLSGTALPSLVVTIRDDEGRPLDEVSRVLAPELSRLLADGAIGAVARRIARVTEEAEAAEAAAGTGGSPGVAVATSGLDAASAIGSAGGDSCALGAAVSGAFAAGPASSPGVATASGGTGGSDAASAGTAPGATDDSASATACSGAVPSGAVAGASSAVGASTRGVATVTSSAPAPGAARDGVAGLDALVHRHAPTLAALAEGQVSLAGLLNGTDFTLPLHQARSDGRTPAWLSTLTLWGGGEYRRLSNNNAGLDWQGDAVSARLGLDARVRGNWLVGVAGAFGRGTVDELGQDSDGALQEYRLTLGSVLPYLAWTPRPGMQLWLSGGYGQGSVRLKGVGQSVRSDAAQHLVAGGGSVRLLARGASRLHLRVEGQGVWLDIDGSAASAGSAGGGLSAHKVRTRTVRALLEGRRTVVLSGGGVLIPALSLGARHDGGDGDTGTGALVGGSVRYQGLRGLALDAGGEVLLGRGDYREWGVWGLVSWEQGAGGRGWSLRLAPRYGLGAGPGFGSGMASGFGTGNSEWLWQRGTAGADTLATAAPASAQLDLRLGYGLARGLGLFSPYGTLSLYEAARRLRLGVQWRLGEQWDLDLAGERLEQTGANPTTPRANPEHRILLEGRLRY